MGLLFRQTLPCSEAAARAGADVAVMPPSQEAQRLVKEWMRRLACSLLIEVNDQHEA